MRRTICLVPLALLSSTYLALPRNASAQRAVEISSTPVNEEEAALDVGALFLTHCASCHGEKGDGKGTTDLDRAARSFMDGGFSFGNTPTALYRTITHGIPGSPMPSFEGALKEEERRALADYVLTLGPPIQEVSGAEMEMIVEDAPRFVRGKLPPLWEGDIVRPRGLVVGTPDGFSFVYDAQNFTLLQVRTGRFVKRTDWGGRGGSALELLSRPLWSRSPKDIADDWTALLGEDFPAEMGVQIFYTSVTRSRPDIGFTIHRHPEAWSGVGENAREVIQPFSVLGVAGFTRHVALTPAQHILPENRILPPLIQPPVWTKTPLPDGRVLLRGVHAPGQRNRATAVRFDVLILPAGDDELVSRVERELAR